MFRCGVDYSRCRWILPLLLIFAIIFDIIAIAAQSGWCQDGNAENHYTSMWEECRGRDDTWNCRSLMDYKMFRCGVDWSRCRCILPLLLIFAIIFDIIAIAAPSGWCQDENAETLYTNMWKECRGSEYKWDCTFLMEYSWAKATAALMIIGLLILIVAFIVSIIGMCDSTFGVFITVGVLLFIVVILQFIALIIYPVNFNEKIFEGRYDYTWAYGFGWGATIICLGCSFIFCCLTRCLEKVNGDEKVKYIYTSN